MSTITALLLSPALLAAPPAGDCGTSDPVALPDFSLVDVNPGSATFEQSVSLSDHAGEATVLYWAYAP